MGQGDSEAHCFALLHRSNISLALFFESAIPLQHSLERVCLSWKRDICVHHHPCTALWHKGFKYLAAIPGSADNMKGLAIYS